MLMLNKQAQKIIMPKSAKPSSVPTFPKPGWRIVAVISLALNVSLVGTWFYLLHYNQYPLLQAEVSQRCNEPGYTRFMHQIEKAADGKNVEQNKKFAAASLCFVDYETGKSVDLDSIKPNPNSPASLPAKP
jgi:hypothetical protein